MNPVLIVVIVFGGSFLLMIPFLILSSRRKNKEMEFAKINHGKAILHVYSDKTKIDNIDIKKLNYTTGENLQKIVSLEPGLHSFEGRFSTTSSSIGNKNYTSEILKFEINLEANHKYTLDIYFYSPEERYSYYKGDVGKDVFTLPLVVNGGIYSKAYIICYQED